jgi:hypothetical protein
VSELWLLVTARTDLVGDRVRMVNRLRDVLSGYFPVERSFEYAHSRGALTLPTGYQTPQAIRRRGEARLRTWLVKRKVRSAEQIAAAALTAAKAQQTVVPGQDVAASIVADLAIQLLAIGSRISELDTRISSTFRAHPQAKIIESLPGMGPILCAELVAAPETSAATRTTADSPRRPGSCPSRATRDAALGTCTGRCTTPRKCAGCSTSPPEPP